MKKAVSYMRMSTDKQEYSIDSQERLIKNYAKSHGIIIVDSYIDEGISGKLAEKRPSFLKMIDDSSSDKFDIVLIYDSSRFARNLEQSLVYKSILKKNGVDLISITEPVFDDDTSLITDALFGAMNEMYVRKLSKNVKRGMEQKVLRGEYIGRLPLGYKKDVNSNLIINPSEAEIVKYIFSAVKNNYSYFSLSKELNEKGFRSAYGSKFELRTIKYVLTNPVYKGYVRANVNDNNIYVKGIHEVIIEENFFDEVQEIIKERSLKHNKKAQPPERGKHWLSGLIRCYFCNHAFSYKKGYNGRVDRFCCVGNNHGFCKEGSKTITVEKLSELVLTELRKIYNTPEEFFSLNIKIPAPTSIINYDLEIKILNQSLTRAKEAYLAGVDTLAEYEENKNRLTKEINSLEKAKSENSSNNHFDKKSFSRKLSNAIKVIDSDSPLIEKQNIIRNLIEKVVVNTRDKTIELYFYA